MNHEPSRPKSKPEKRMGTVFGGAKGPLKKEKQNEGLLWVLALNPKHVQG